MKFNKHRCEPSGIVQPPADSPGGKTPPSVWPKPPFLSALGGLLAGLLFLLMGMEPAWADQNPPGCSGSGLGINLFTSSPDVHLGDTITYSVTVFNGLIGTGRTVCDATEIQAFVVTPDGVSHPVTLTRTSLSNGQLDFYANVISYVVRAQDVRPDGTVRATASDTGVIHQNDTNSQGGGDQGVNTQVSLPCIAIGVQCTGSVGQFGAINFTGSVTNCGNNTLVGVTVTNRNDNGSFTVTFPTNLLAGGVARFSGSFIPLTPCTPDTVVLVATGVDQFTTNPRTVTATASSTCSTVLNPAIKVTLACPVGPIRPGQLLTFTGTVTNTGDVTLTNVVVLSDHPANTPVFTVASLAPGVGASFSGGYLAPVDCSTTSGVTANGTSLCGVAVSDRASATCPILTTPLIAVTAVCPVTPVLPGGVLAYSGTVRNLGDIPLTNVVVTSDRPAAHTVVFTAATLAPGATASFTSSSTVPTNTCSVLTTFSGTGQDICTLASVTNSVSTSCTLTTAPAIAVTLACPAVSATTGGSITYTGTVRNAGNVTLNNVFVVNNHPAAGTPVIGPITLAPGAISSFTASFTAPVDACSVSSTVIATGSDSCTAAVVTSTASATCDLLTAPSLVVTQFCPTTPAVPGGVLSYTGTVKNSGNITLATIVVLNNMSGSTPVFTLASLAPGASANFTGSYVAPTNCSVADTLTATALSTCGIAVTNAATFSCPILTTPQIAMTAVCPTAPVLPGGSIVYSGTVRNLGNITLTNVTILSDRPAANTVVFTTAALAPGASASFTSSVLVPTNACSVLTSFSSVASDICTLNTVTNKVTATCTVTTAPLIAVTLACPAVSAPAGGSITYTGTVRNAGNVTLNNVFVVNNHPAANSPVIGPITLAPGAISSFTASFTAPLDACSVVSTVIATGSDSCTSVVVTSTASATCDLLTAPAIAVTQSCPVNPPVPGALLTYSGTVRNPGNITLNNILVLNNLTGATPVFTLASLAPGASANFTGSYVTPTNCSTANILTVTGASSCGVAVSSTASSTCPILTMPALTVTQVCPTNAVLQGGVLTYIGTVRNIGDVTLTNILVYSDRPGSNTVIFSRAALAPGAVASFTGSYQVPINCCVVSSTVQATGQTCSGVTVSDSATKTCTVFTSPSLAITKICAPGILKPGDLLAYSGSISNSGNITLINVTVVNSQTPNIPPLLGPIDLAPGESFTYEGSYIVPTDFCGADTVTASGVNVCTLLPVLKAATTTCPILTPPPRLAVTKNCPLLPTPRGGLYTFTGSVRNPGTVTLVDVYVVNSEPTNNTPVIGPITLAPGATVNFTASYIAPECCCLIFDTLTARGHDRCLGSNVTATASSSCPLLTTPGVALLQNCPAIPIPMGSLYSFSGFVTNTGDTVLTNVFVFGPQGTNTPVLGPIELAPGESEYYFGTYMVPFEVCSVSVSVRAQSVCSGLAVGNSVSCPVDTLPQIALMTTCPTTPLVPGGPIVYNGTVSNAGNITLIDVAVISDQPAPNTTVFTLATLAPGASARFSSSTYAPTNACSVFANFRGVGRSSCTPRSVTNSVSLACELITEPGIAITQACPVVPPVPGSLLTYSGSVRNSGDITISNIVVLNNRSGATPVFTLASLLPGATANFTGSFLTPTNCSVTDVLTASGLGSCGLIVSNTAIGNCPIATVPMIAVSALCPVIPALPGGLLTYSGTISNAGTIALTNVAVLSDQPVPNTTVLTVAYLAPGAFTNFTSSVTAPANACSVLTTFLGVGQDVCSLAKVTNSAATTCTLSATPGIAVTQLCPTTPSIPGSLLTYSGTVRNSGDVTLTGVLVRNSLTGATPVFTLASLLPGASANFTGSFLTPTNCSVSDTLTVTSQSLCGTAVSNAVTAICPIGTVPLIAVSALCPVIPALPGGLLTYTGTISNAGTIALTNVAVLSDQPVPNTTVLTVAYLPPGAFTNFTSSVTAPANACSVLTTFLGVGQDVCSLAKVTNSAATTCTLSATPGIAVTQLCPTTPSIPGSLLTYSGTVRNSGDVTLTGVVVRNNLSGATPVFTLASLLPGATANFTGSFLTPTNCSVSDTLTVTSQSLCGTAVSNAVTAICPIGTVPLIAVSALCPVIPALPGGLLTYSGTISNAGTIALTNVAVLSDQPVPNTTVLTVAYLAPGTFTNFTSSVTAPADACSVLTTFLGVGRDVCSLVMVTNTAAAVCTLTNSPLIAITETCPLGLVSAGASVVFAGTVSNPGDVTLVNVFVYSRQFNTNSLVLGPITLAPGASVPFTGNYIALGGSDSLTNSTIVTNSIATIVTNISNVITTNTVVTYFTNAPFSTVVGTIDTASKSVVDRFAIGTGFSGLTYAGEDHGYGATDFYSMRKDVTGISYFDTIIASTATTTDRFSASNRSFDALTYAAGDLGYGPLLFYYLSHDNAGVSTFGSITPGGVVGVIADHFVVGSNFDALTFTATDVGYGANLFYYIRHDSTGLSTFGTINPALPGTITDRFTVGTNVDALVFTDLSAPGYGANNFYYLRHDSLGVSTFGTIFVTSPTTANVTDRFNVGTNATELTFTATDAGTFGPNLFYFLRPGRLSVGTNIVTTFTTNLVSTFTTNVVFAYMTNSFVTFTPTNTVTAIGTGPCQSQTVTAAANCLGPVTLAKLVSIPAQLTEVSGVYSLYFPTRKGQQLTIQFKDTLNAPEWTTLKAMLGTGSHVIIEDPTAAQHPCRFYRITSTE